MKYRFLCVIETSNFKVGENPLIYRSGYDLAFYASYGRQRNGFYSLGFSLFGVPNCVIRNKRGQVAIPYFQVGAVP